MSWRRTTGVGRRAEGAALVGGLLLILCRPASPVWACGFDGLMGASLSAQHPKSLGVAFAVRDAVAGGVVDAAAIAPIEPGPKGYWRAAGHVQTFLRRIVSVKDRGTLPSLSLLFIESQFWSSLKATTHGFDLELHTAGPEAQDVVIVTNETVLSALIDGSLSPHAAQMESNAP